jgi:hypothetical protein
VFYKMLGNYRVASQLVGSRVVFSSIELLKLASSSISCSGGGGGGGGSHGNSSINLFFLERAI